jgi:predicted nucleic acid-binding protein
MEKPVLPDTDVLIDFLRGHAKAVALVRSCEDRLILSAVVVSELYAGVRDAEEETVLDEFIALFRVLPVSAEIARTGGLLKRDFGRSHGVGLADALVAATVLSENAELKTLNVRHYPMIKGLRAAYAK